MRLQLNRILDSGAFANAGRAASFLRFVVERKLEGRADEIKESVIALEVLGRSSSFDSKSDPIVRVEAARLRGRLSSYYEAEGAADPLLISLPKGRYVPEFIERQSREGLNSAGALQLSILPPEGASFEYFAVSQDGRKLAFVAPRNGKMVLWLRALDSLECKALPGTDDALWPFWSPDSRSIAFFARSRLKILDLSGGPAREIADVLVGLGGAWSSRGLILFCPRPTGPLYQVSEAGGSPAQVTQLDAERGEVSHGFPQFLPDGIQFLFQAASWRPGESAIRIASLDSRDSKVLVSADTSAAYAPVLRGHPGSLLFVHAGALMAQALDSQTRQLSGERSVIVPDIRYTRWRQAAFSVSANGILLYQRGGPDHRQFTWLDRRGQPLAAIERRNDYISFSLSPDDRYAAVSRFDDPSTVYPTIWMLDFSRDAAASRFTDPDAAQAHFNPVWSADSREILFSRGDDRRMRLFRQAITGGPAECILDTDGPKFPTDWSSDGRAVFYTSQFPDFRHLHVWLLGIDGGKASCFLEHSHEECSARFSPCAGNHPPKWVAYTSNETGRYEIYIRDLPTGSHKWQISTLGGFHPHWRRDGRELFFLSLDGKLMSVAITDSNTLEFETPQPLFPTGLHFLPQYNTWMNQYAVSQDGQRFLLNGGSPDPGNDAIIAMIPW